MALVDRVRFAFVCPLAWEKLTRSPDVVERYCGACKKTVTDLSAMSAAQAERFLEERDDAVCVRIEYDEARRPIHRGTALAGGAVALAATAGTVAVPLLAVQTTMGAMAMPPPASEPLFFGPIVPSVEIGGGEAEDVGDDDRGAIKAIVQKNAGQLKYCYERRLMANPNLSGRVEITWTIDGGRVTATELFANTTGDAELAECIQRRVSRWSGFPEGAEGEVQWPFVFKQKQVIP